ncbi:YaiI/YqxD family protein [Turicibacter bilis]|uniref:YaiI/YqxD family protein n=1 Tax=Turicibacter bilis TaxID=2735723 RepID=UPI002A611C72|nr:YaiI/YqxD family protein [Turicibacter sp.]
MNIYIDADGCPVVKETIKVAKQFGVPVVIVCDAAHYFMHDGVQTITVMQGSDAVDYEIINRLQPGDLVITQDYGLGALVLAKKGYAMNQNGKRYEDQNIDQLLFTRHLSSKLRQSGQRLKGPKKRTREDTQQFILALTNFLKSIQEGQSH